MSTESYVNRVNQTFVQDEFKKLEPASVDLNYDANGSTVEHPDAVTAPATEEYEDSIGNLASPSNPDPTSMLASLIVTKAEFERFKSQVMMALRHSGLDVRKFFSE